MKNIGQKLDHFVGDDGLLFAGELMSIYNTLKSPIIYHDQLDENDDDQLTKAIVTILSTRRLKDVSTTPNNIILPTIVSPILVDNYIIEFTVNNINTSTDINLKLGDKDTKKLLSPDGVIGVGKLKTGRLYKAVYKQDEDKFYLVTTAVDVDIEKLNSSLNETKTEIFDTLSTGVLNKILENHIENTYKISVLQGILSAT